MHRLNIVSGELAGIESDFPMTGKLIYFNECMIDGKTCSDIFSKEFFDTRYLELVSLFGISETAYLHGFIYQIHPLINCIYDEVMIWYEESMFGQMNLLTMLAYLEQSYYRSKIILRQYHEDTTVSEQLLESIEGCHELYVQVLINNTFDEKFYQQISCTKQLPRLEASIKNYIDYQKRIQHIQHAVPHFSNVKKQDLINVLLVN